MKRTLITTAILLFAGQASAAVISLENWGFDPDGAGATAMVQPIDEMTYLGLSYTDSDSTVVGGAGTIDNGDTFKDVGRLSATGFQNDFVPFTGGIGVDYSITAVFTDWTGTYGDTLIDSLGRPITRFDFDPGGTFQMYVDDTMNEGPIVEDTSIQNFDDGTPILEAEIVKGSGTIDFANTSGVDGNVDIQFVVTDAAAGYFFYDTDNDGTPDTDLADLLCDLVVDPTCVPTYFGLTDSNNAIQNISTDGLGGTHDQLDEFEDVANFATPLDYDGGIFDIVTTNDGSYAPAIKEVSEPGMLSLMGLAFLGLAGLRRRRKED